MNPATVGWTLRFVVVASMVAMIWGFRLLFFAQSDAPPPAPTPIATLDSESAQEEEESIVPLGEAPSDHDLTPGDVIDEPSKTDNYTTETLDDPARPLHLAVPAHDIAVEIDPTGPSYESNRFNPAPGRLDFWLEPDTAKPCETGPSFMLGHVTDVFADLTTGTNDDRNRNVEAGSKVVITLEDGTECIYEVIDFDLAIGEPVEGTPAHRVRKDDWSSAYWGEAIHSSGERPLLFLLTSSGTEIEPSGHRAHNDIVMAELSSIHAPDG